MHGKPISEVTCYYEVLLFKTVLSNSNLYLIKHRSHSTGIEGEQRLCTIKFYNTCKHDLIESIANPLYRLSTLSSSPSHRDAIWVLHLKE